MKRPRRRQIEPTEIRIEIEEFETSYFVIQHYEVENRVDDEACLELRGRIVAIGGKRANLLGEVCEIRLLCSRSFGGPDKLPGADEPFFLSAALKRGACCLAAYLPADTFWALSSLARANLLGHVEASVGPSRYGNADLLSLQFTSRPQPRD